MSTKKAIKILSYLFIFALIGGCTSSTPSEPTARPTATQRNTPKPTRETLIIPDNPYGDEVSFEIGQPYNGLSMKSGGGVDTEIVTLPRTDQQAFRSGNGAALPAADGNNDPDLYIQFQVDDDFIYKGSPTSRVTFVIEYLDDGTDIFLLQYDALSGGANGNGQYKDTAVVRKTGTGEIKTVEISVCDANFANRDQDADFRISDDSDGAETILRVSVRMDSLSNSAEINVDSCGANPFDDQPDSDAIQSCIVQACDGDTVLFTSGVDDPEYQGYLIDKTVFLVYPQAKSNLTFSSTDENNHALLKATAELHGFLVHLQPRILSASPGSIDNITIHHLDLDGNRAERVCMGDPLPGEQNAHGEGENDNWGSWLPGECQIRDDSWCNPGTLYLSGAVDYNDPAQNYEAHPGLWSTGFVVQDVTLSNTECGTAFFFSGAEFLIDSVTVDTAGDHVHARGCALTGTERDDPVGAWSDGITYLGPAHQLTNNLVIDASDVGMVSFGGRDILIANNTIQASPGNHGMFAGIAMHANTLGLISGLQVMNNRIINEADQTCGGIHIGINLGQHTWGNGCEPSPTAADFGIVDDCSLFSPAPEGASCDVGTACRTWAEIASGTSVTLTDNYVEGAQVSYVISGLDALGELIISGNQSVDPHLVDWEGDINCVWTEGRVDSWGALDFVAFDPALEGWEEIFITCAR